MMSDDHNALEQSYREVFSRVTSNVAFDKSWLQRSIDLFDFLEDGSVAPKLFEVEALVSGLKFSGKVVDVAVAIQNKVQRLLVNTKSYWVLPENLAVEWLVLKWPEGSSLEPEYLLDIVEFVENLNIEPFKLTFRGFQFHMDGCVILRGFDEEGRIIKLRREILRAFNRIPRRQSSWAHVPLGRILEVPIDNGLTFQKLKDYASLSQAGETCVETIDSIKQVKEHQWYMVDREIVKEVKFNDVVR